MPSSLSSPESAGLSQPAGVAPTVLVVGSFVQACCWRVDRLPKVGESVAASGLHIELGGKGLNVGVGLARLGCEVAMVLAHGTDEAALRLQALLDAERVNRRYAVQVPGHSGMGCGLVGPDGDNQIAVFGGANDRLEPAHIRAARPALLAAQAVYAQLEAPLPAVETAFVMALEAGVTTVLNPSPWRPVTATLRTSTNVLLVNAVEAAALQGEGAPVSKPEELQTPHGAARFLANVAPLWPNLQQLIVTLGAHGSLGLERARPGSAWQGWHLQACLAKAVDNVGAGDAYAAACLAARLRGQPLVQAMREAHWCAAHVVAGEGVLTRLPRSEQLAGWMHSSADMRLTQIL